MIDRNRTTLDDEGCKKIEGLTKKRKHVKQREFLHLLWDCHHLKPFTWQRKCEVVSSKSTQFIANLSQDGDTISNSLLISKSVNTEVVKEATYLRLKICDCLVVKLTLLSCWNSDWSTISKTTFTECKGENENGETRYSLGRISFDLYKPIGLSCSIDRSKWSR
jgi:hypothetical protein